MSLPARAGSRELTEPRVVVVAGRRLFGETLARSLRLGGLDAHAVQTLSLVAVTRTDVVLLDAALAVGPAVACLTARDAPPVRVLLISCGGPDNDRLPVGLRAFGMLCAQSTPTEVADAVRRAATRTAVRFPRHELRADGSPGGLTDRELDVTGLIAGGFGNEDIAAMLSISAHTVRTHVQNILAKLQVSSRLAAVAEAERIGLINGSLPAQRTSG